MIEALRVRYIEDFKPENRREQDQAWCRCYERLGKKISKRLEHCDVIWGCVFLLEKDDFEVFDNPNVTRLHNVLLSVLERDIIIPSLSFISARYRIHTNTRVAAPCARH